jgi:hypothetical protein
MVKNWVSCLRAAAWANQRLPLNAQVLHRSTGSPSSAVLVHELQYTKQQVR